MLLWIFFFCQIRKKSNQLSSSYFFKFRAVIVDFVFFDMKENFSSKSGGKQITYFLIVVYAASCKLKSVWVIRV